MLSPITTPNNIIIVGIVVYNLFYLPKNSDQSSFSFPIMVLRIPYYRNIINQYTNHSFKTNIFSFIKKMNIYDFGCKGKQNFQINN